MSTLQALILGIVQGATEFLPVSSSGHLALIPWWIGWDIPEDLIFAVAAHLGTLTAVLIYFWRDWLAVLRGALHIATTRRVNTDESRLVGLLAVGTLPIVLGAMLHGLLEDLFQAPAVVAVCLLGTALLLTVSERLSARQTANQTPIEGMTWLDALLIGMAQLLAILPGISRSGSTIAAGLARGISREDAARYSFLLGTPAILGAGLITAIQAAGGYGGTVEWPTLLVGFMSAAVVGFAAIALLLAFVRRHKLYGFAIYCAAFGLVTLAAILLGR